MLTVVRIFLTSPTKSISGSLTYKKLPIGKLFMYVKKVFTKI